jgi:hypothetical protein
MYQNRSKYPSYFNPKYQAYFFHGVSKPVEMHHGL